MKKTLLFAIYLTLMCLLNYGCKAASDKDGMTRSWGKDDILNWRYKLSSTEEIMIFHFSENGLVATQIGKIDGPIASPMMNWSINNKLLIVDSPDSSKPYSMELLGLNDSRAKVRINDVEKVFSRQKINE